MRAKNGNQAWTRARDFGIVVALMMLPLFVHGRGVWSDCILSAVDTPQAYFPLRWLVVERLKQGSAPFWNEYLLGGMPLAAQPDAQAWYVPGWLLWFFLPPAPAFNVTLLLHYGLAGVFMFLLLREIKLHAAAAACGALSFMWCGFLTGHRVHSAMVETAVWLPGLLWVLFAWWERRRRIWLVLIAGISAVQLFSGYMQIVLMTWGMAGLLLLMRWVAEGRAWRVALAASAALLAGALLASFHWLNVLEFAQHCTRAALTYAQFSLGAFPWRDLWGVCFPFLRGAQWHVSLYQGVPYYRGVENYAEMAAYTGAGITLASVAAMWQPRARWALIFASVAACVSLLMMVGSQTVLWQVMYHVPLVNKFRISARYVLVLHAALAILGGLGLDVILSAEVSRWRRAAALGVMGMALVTLAGVVLRGHVPGLHVSAAWVRIPLWCAAGVWVCGWLSLLPSWWGRAIAWAPVLIVAYEMTRYGYNGISSNVTELLTTKKLPAPGQAYRRHFSNVRPLPRVFNCFRHYMAKDLGIGPNRNILMGIPTLDAYGPLYLKPFAWLGHDPSGFYTTVDELLRDNDVLSMLHATSIAEFNGGVTFAPRIERVITTNSPIVLPALRKWNGSLLYVQNSGVLVMTGAPAVVYTQVSLRSNTAYRITVDAAARHATDALRIDLFAPGYDNDAQEMSVTPLMLASQIQRFQHVIETGPNIPAQVLLRIFTFSSSAIYVTNVQLEELEGLVQVTRPVEWYEPLGERLWRNRRACPYAWFVHRIVPAPSRWAALDWIAQSPVAFSPRDEALVEGVATEEVMASARVVTNTVSPNARRWEIENVASNDAFLVISEIWYPGWCAELDGRRVSYYRVNGVLSGVRIPPGPHTLVIKFRPARWMVTSVLTLSGSLLLAYLVLYPEVSQLTLSTRSCAECVCPARDDP